MQDVRDQQPEKAAGYRELVGRFGAEKVGAAVLAKWMSDPDSDTRWQHLAAVIQMTPAPMHWPREAPPAARTRKYWIVLWYVSMGYANKDVAEQLGVGLETVKQDLIYARLKLGLIGAPMPLVVATAIRQGRIP